jgi:large subunit ribosomal protein L10
MLKIILLYFFANEDAVEISGILATEKSPQKAKPDRNHQRFNCPCRSNGVSTGTGYLALSAVGLHQKSRLEKLHILKEKVVCKKGEIISEQKASILAKLNIVPFKVGIEPVAAYLDGKVYADIKIDKEGMLKELEDKFGRALPFAVEIGYVSDDTLDFIFAKAKAYEGVITRIITGEREPVAVTAAVEIKQEETKKEEPKAEASEGLASLFG